MTRIVITVLAIFAGSTPYLLATPPNVVVIFCDDLGYADIGPFGSPYETPHLEKLASEGRKFTNFYAAQAVCSASRAGLLTGCYPNRIGILGALGPQSQTGINPKEVTIAEMLRSHGYATAIFGKWHLGHLPDFYPSQHGFDEYFGLPYSNDMWPLHPSIVNLPANVSKRKQKYPNLALWQGTPDDGHSTYDPEITPDDQKNLTKWYTEHAVDFINRHTEQPFFLYVPHSMPHVPIFASDAFEGKSGMGLYADVIQEIDWSVGQILETLKAQGLDENTLVIFTSDNGPWLSYGDHAGSAGPLREGKGTAWDGGQREPTIAWWPGHIPAGTSCDEFAGTIDLLPTIANLTGAKLPDHTIDGKDCSALFLGKDGAKSPHEAFYFYWGDALHAVRDHEWKLHFPHNYRSLDGRRGGTDGVPVPYEQKHTDLALYHLAEDIGEVKNVATEHPDVVARLTQLANVKRAEIGDSLTKTKGNSNRPPGRASQNAETSE